MKNFTIIIFLAFANNSFSLDICNNLGGVVLDKSGTDTNIRDKSGQKIIDTIPSKYSNEKSYITEIDTSLHIKAWNSKTGLFLVDYIHDDLSNKREGWIHQSLVVASFEEMREDISTNLYSNSSSNIIVNTLEWFSEISILECKGDRAKIRVTQKEDEKILNVYTGWTENLNLHRPYISPN